MFGRIILSSVIGMVIAQVIWTIEALIDMPFYQAEAYFGVWSKLMMPDAGPPPMSFIFWGLLFGFITWLLVSVVYAKIHKGLPGKKWLSLALILTAVHAIPMGLVFVLIINLPLLMVISWTIHGLVAIFLNSLIISKLIK